jgi:hypothetical protein
VVAIGGGASSRETTSSLVASLTAEPTPAFAFGTTPMIASVERSASR